jgi:peptidoglycan/LPS O-acetylase OafA/YrhL
VKTYPISLEWRLFVWTVCSLCVLGVLMLDDPGRESDAYGRFLEKLGDASYSTYLVHQFAIGAVVRLGLGHWIGGPATFLAAFVAAHVAGVLTHMAIERPLIALFHRGRQKRKALSPAPA